MAVHLAQFFILPSSRGNVGRYPPNYLCSLVVKSCKISCRGKFLEYRVEPLFYFRSILHAIPLTVISHNIAPEIYATLSHRCHER